MRGEADARAFQNADAQLLVGNLGGQTAPGGDALAVQ